MSSIGITLRSSLAFLANDQDPAVAPTTQAPAVESLLDLPTGIGLVERGSLEEQILRELGALPRSWK